MLRDLKYAFRALGRIPRLSAFIVILLSLGSGTTTAIFSIYNGLVLRLLPVPDPQSLVVLTVTGENGAADNMSYAAFDRLRRTEGLFAGLFAYVTPVSIVQVGDEIRPLGTLRVSADYFRVLGVRPMMGELIGPKHIPAADMPEPVAVLTEPFWRSAFGSDPNVVGKGIQIGNTTYTIIGVTEPGFGGTKVGFTPTIITPLQGPASATGDAAVTPWADVMGRLAPGVTRAQAQARLATHWSGLTDSISREVVSRDARERILHQRVALEDGSAGTSLLRTRFSRGLSILLVVAGIILGLACLNSGALLLARAAARRHEFMVRMALGARRWHLIRAGLAEGLVLAAAGLAGGVVVAYVTVSALSQFLLIGNTRPDLQLSPDATAFLFAAGLTCGTVLVLGIIPTVIPLRSALTVRQTIGRGVLPGSTAIVVVQTATSIVLLASAFVFHRTVSWLGDVGLTSDPEQVVLTQLIPKPGGYRNVDMHNYYGELLRKISSTPGIDAAALSRRPPVDERDDFLHIKTRQDARYEVTAQFVSPGFFSTVGVPLLGGRDFTALDHRSAPTGCIPSQALARRLFGDENPVGRTIATAEGEPGQCTVVGVAATSPLHDLRRTGMMTLYLPLLQHPSVRNAVLVTRSSGGARLSRQAIEATLRSLGRETQLYSRTFQETVDMAVAQERLGATIGSFAAGIAILLCLAGVYSTIDFAATSRTSEIAVRRALGAPAVSVLKVVIGNAAATVVVGIVIGIPLAWAANNVIASAVVVGPGSDVALLLLVGLTLLLLTALASIVPARRALRTDVAAALRSE